MCVNELSLNSLSPVRRATSKRRLVLRGCLSAIWGGLSVSWNTNNMLLVHWSDAIAASDIPAMTHKWVSVMAWSDRSDS